MANTYDPKCFDLASHFLSDIPTATDDDRSELALELQSAAEEFLSEMACCRSCGACPGFIGAECDGDCEHAKAEAAQ